MEADGAIGKGAAKVLAFLLLQILESVHFIKVKLYRGTADGLSPLLYPDPSPCPCSRTQSQSQCNTTFVTSMSCNVWRIPSVLEWVRIGGYLLNDISMLRIIVSACLSSKRPGLSGPHSFNGYGTPGATLSSARQTNPDCNKA